MKLQRLLAAVITAALLLTGCTSLSLNERDILSPPQAAGNRAEIEKLIEKDAQGDYTLITPTSGDNKSGVTMVDLNKDGKEEAVALYTTANGSPKMLIAESDGNSYRTLGSVQLNSPSVYRLDFADIDGDSNDELLIGCDVGTQTSNLHAYFADSDLTNLIVAEGFVDYVAGDFDGNSASDVLLFLAPDKDAIAKASLTVYVEGKFSEVSSCDIDPAIVRYAKISYDRISEDLDAAIADGVLENGKFTTQTLYYDTAADTMVNPLFVFSGYSDSVRTSPITSFDMDDDGIVEIPMCSLMEHSKSEDDATVCSLARWSNYDPKQMAPVLKQNSILCDKLGFMLNVDEETAGEVTARYTDDDTVKVYSLAIKDGAPALGDELLTVKRYSRSSFDSAESGETTLHESTKYIYTYTLGKDSSFLDEDVKDGFMQIEEYLYTGS